MPLCIPHLAPGTLTLPLFPLQPLTKKMTLLDLQQRMPVYDSQLAQVLVALRAGLQLLRWRYMKLVSKCLLWLQQVKPVVVQVEPEASRWGGGWQWLS